MFPGSGADIKNLCNLFRRPRDASSSYLFIFGLDNSSCIAERSRMAHLFDDTLVVVRPPTLSEFPYSIERRFRYTRKLNRSTRPPDGAQVERNLTASVNAA